MSLRHRISSPLEAGPSILDAHRLPPHLDAALEYAASRLARKGLAATLLVVRREYQLPAAFRPAAAPSEAFPLATPPASPAPPSSATAHAGPFRFASTIKSLVRAGTHPVLPTLDRAAAFDLQRSRTVSPAFSLSSMSSFDSVASTPRWPLSPLTPADPHLPMTPATTATTASSVATESSGHQGPNAFGIRLVHAAPLGVRHERAVRQVIERAERKFRIGTDWLPPAEDRAAYGLSAELVQRSLAQNEALFASGGLTLLALDRLYTFKSALAAYSAQSHALTGGGDDVDAGGDDGHLRLEDAVDELRRCVLANGRRPLRRGALLRAYDGCLRFTDAALADVCRMYARAYGGPDGDDGVVGDALTMSPVAVAVPVRDRAVVEKPLPKIPSPVEEEGPEEVAEPAVQGPHDEIAAPARCAADEMPGNEARPTEGREGREAFVNLTRMAVATATVAPIVVTPRTSPVVVTPRTSPSVSKATLPQLRLQTTFDAPGKRKKAEVPAAADEKWEMSIHLEEAGAVESDEEEEDLTARPTGPAGGMPRWSGAGGFSIDEIISEDRGPHLLGPTTPHGFDDISPITRGEWGFLVGSQMGRTVAVTTC